MIAWIKYQIAWQRWFWGGPRLGGDELGKSREMRNQNIGIMLDRWYAREPKRPTRSHGRKIW